MRQFVQDPALAGGLHHGTGLAQGLELPFQLLELADARCDPAKLILSVAVSEAGYLHYEEGQRRAGGDAPHRLQAVEECVASGDPRRRVRFCDGGGCRCRARRFEGSALAKKAKVGRKT